MKRNKIKKVLILLIIMVLSLSVGVYAGYQFSANNVTYTNPDGTTVTVKEALDELREKSKVATAEASTATTHTASDISEYGWDELSSMAKAISNNSGITKDTLEVKVTMSGTTKTLGVGDYTTVDSKKVRILGFNHDPLATATAYDGAETATGNAGISFEYVDLLLTSAQMNSSNTNSGGWANCALRSTLNGTTYNSLSIKDKIKQVTKDYIPTWNSSTTTTCSDYLWLLSCAEIWDNGYKSTGKGYASGTEGSQYKYYKIGNPKYYSDTDYIKKPSTSAPSTWWLRSTSYYYSTGFCVVYAHGSCGDGNGGATPFSGVAPGFSI